MVAIEAVTTTGETSALCQSVGLARATRRAPSVRALVPAERQAVLDVLHSERFVDHSPAEVQATLLEEQTYLYSTRTMYRILDAAQGVGSGAIKRGIRSLPDRSSWRRPRIKSDRGTSRS